MSCLIAIKDAEAPKVVEKMSSEEVWRHVFTFLETNFSPCPSLTLPTS